MRIVFTVIEHLDQWWKMIDPFQHRYIRDDRYHQLEKIVEYWSMVKMSLVNRVYL